MEREAEERDRKDYEAWKKKQDQLRQVEKAKEVGVKETSYNDWSVPQLQEEAGKRHLHPPGGPPSTDKYEMITWLRMNDQARRSSAGLRGRAEAEAKDLRAQSEAEDEARKLISAAASREAQGGEKSRVLSPRDGKNPDGTNRTLGTGSPRAREPEGGAARGGSPLGEQDRRRFADDRSFAEFLARAETINLSARTRMGKPLRDGPLTAEQAGVVIRGDAQAAEANEQLAHIRMLRDGDDDELNDDAACLLPTTISLG